MFEAGFTELLLIFVLGLLVLGPERLPRVAAQLGRWMGRARRTASQLRRQLEREVALAEFAERHPRPPKLPIEGSTDTGTTPGADHVSAAQSGADAAEPAEVSSDNGKPPA